MNDWRWFDAHVSGDLSHEELMARTGEVLGYRADKPSPNTKEADLFAQMAWQFTKEGKGRVAAYCYFESALHSQPGISAASRAKYALDIHFKHSRKEG